MDSMKKTKKQIKRKQKIDVVLESLLNLEQKVEEKEKTPENQWGVVLDEVRKNTKLKLNWCAKL
jgi:hypothetical protein